MSNPTYAFFRTDKVNHLFTVAVALHPSPDWFLGVTRFELCQEDNTWLPERELDLYPWDAGTDSGVSYEVSPYFVVGMEMDDYYWLMVTNYVFIEANYMTILKNIFLFYFSGTH